MKALITVALFTAVTIAVWLTTRAGMAQALGPKAIIVKYKSTQYLDGKPVPSGIRLSELAVRADGSLSDSRRVISRDGKEYLQNTITDVTAQRRVVADGITKSLTTYMLSNEHVKSLKNPGAQCTSVTAPVRGTHLGFETLTVTDDRVPNRVLESSYAPDLGCVLLRKVVRHKAEDQDPMRVALIVEATSVEFGEQADARFAIPDWKERSPSAVIAEYEQKFDLSSPSHSTESRAMKDRAYYANQTIR